MRDTCSDRDLESLMASLASDPVHALGRVDQLVAEHPHDARLHFVRGSILAGTARSIEAHAAFVRAVDIAPDYAIARFQLGLFELTSGEPSRAMATWAPLIGSDTPSYLRFFVEGLHALIEDRFDAAIDAIERGIAANGDNAPLNRDMQLIIDEIRRTQPNDRYDPEISATSLLLDQFGIGSTRH